MSLRNSGSIGLLGAFWAMGCGSSPVQPAEPPTTVPTAEPPAPGPTTPPPPQQQTCGGLAGVQCPEGFDCVDDLSDSCDPAAGGRDCSGVCKQSAEPPSSGGGGAVPCGKTTCAAGEVCCNPSCGICTPPNGMCTQQFCE